MEKSINNIKNKVNDRLKEVRKKTGLISFLRLLAFVGGIPFLIAGISERKGWYIFAGVYLLLAFLLLVYVHANINRNIEHDETYIKVLDRYLARLIRLYRNLRSLMNSDMNSKQEP